jgi:membrane-associated phospholipid phosphatase
MIVDSSPRETPATEARRLMTTALLIGLIAAAFALALFSWLGREILLGAAPPLDVAVRNVIHEGASPGVTRVMLAASKYGGPSVLVPVGGGLAAGFLVKRWYRGALLTIITMAGAALLNTLLKHSFARIRPAAFFEYPLPESLSFPSGHAFFAASLLGGFAVLVSGRVRSKGLRVLIWLVALALIGLIGLSRIYLGVHYPSDVLGGFAAAVVWVAAVALGDRVASHRLSRRRA